MIAAVSKSQREIRPRHGLVFESQPTVIASEPNRADIALFVGFVGRRATALPTNIYRWLDLQGWTFRERARLPIEDLLDLPVPLENWQTFDRLFAWDERLIDDVHSGATTLMGAAVRSFFAQGGRKCYVVRAGDPWSLTRGRAERVPQIARLVPGYPWSLDGSPSDASSWHGITHLFGLPDVSYVCMPDLADAVGTDLLSPGKWREPVQAPAQFLECAEEGEEPLETQPVRRLRAPRADEQSYAEWARAVSMTGSLLINSAREVQLVTALPIPEAGSRAEGDLLEFLIDEGRGPLGATPDVRPNGCASAFIQIAYPWARTPGSSRMPEALESPDGILAGVLARNALTRGAFRSAGNLQLGDVFEIAPLLSLAQMQTPLLDNPFSTRSHDLLERISLLGMTPGGWRLLSDVTTSLNYSYRPAAINRLVSAIVRAARRLGENLMFESSGEALWEQLRGNLSDLLLSLLRAGALRGATPGEAFSVRCDRSTMTQNDLDAGRVIAEIQFDAAFPIERLGILMTLNQGGQVSLLTDSLQTEATS